MLTSTEHKQTNKFYFTQNFGYRRICVSSTWHKNQAVQFYKNSIFLDQRLKHTGLVYFSLFDTELGVDEYEGGDDLVEEGEEVEGGGQVGLVAVGPGQLGLGQTKNK